MLFGTVKWFNCQKGYGFIAQDSGKDVFFHITQFEKIGLKKLDNGQKVGFELYNDRGRTAAGNLQLF